LATKDLTLLNFTLSATIRTFIYLFIYLFSTDIQEQKLNTGTNKITMSGKDRKAPYEALTNILISTLG